MLSWGRAAAFGAGVATAVLLLGLAAGGAWFYIRAQRTEPERSISDEKFKRLLEDEREREHQIRREVLDGLVERARGALATPRELPTPLDGSVREGRSRAQLHFLILSGGGQYGAFTAGVLEGWAEVEDPEWARPRFDLVTGVSVGAILATSSLLGAPQEGAVERLFLKARDTWSLDQLWSYLPWRPSIFSEERLAEALRRHLSTDLIDRMAAAAEDGRRALIMATNLDLGRPTVWSLSNVAKEARRTGNYSAYWERVRASASPPPLFPPAHINGMPHVDGGASHLLFLGPRSDLLDHLVDRLEREGMAGSVCVNVWVILSSPLWPNPIATSLEWPDLTYRATNLLMFAIGRTDLEQLQSAVQRLRARDPDLARFRYIAVPSDIETPEHVFFSSSFVHRLGRLGRELGRDPSSWKSDL